MKPKLHMPLWRLTEMFAESRRPAQVQRCFNKASGFMDAVFKAFLAQRYRPVNCPVYGGPSFS